MDMQTVAIEMKAEVKGFDPQPTYRYRWIDNPLTDVTQSGDGKAYTGVEMEKRWDAWLYGLVGTGLDAKANPIEAPKKEARWPPNNKDLQSNIDNYDLVAENQMLEGKINDLNKFFHEYTDEKEKVEAWSITEAKVKSSFLFSDETLINHMYCEEISMGSLGVDERDCWLIVTDKRIIIWRDEHCEHDTTGTDVVKKEVKDMSKVDANELKCDAPTIPNYPDFKLRLYPQKAEQAYQLQDMVDKHHFQGLMNSHFNPMQCTKLRHSDMFFYSIPIGQIRGVNLDWKTATLSGHYRVDLNEGEKAKFQNSCQCHCIVCDKDCSCYKCWTCCPSCKCCKGGKCCGPRYWCHVHPINCYRGCLVKIFRLCCVPLRPFCDNPICRMVCCSRFIPSCWRKIDDECIQTCCTNYKVGVLRRMDIFQVRELLGAYKFNDGEARFEFESDQNAGVIDTLKGTKHFIRMEYAMQANGPLFMLKARAGSKLGTDAAIPIVKLCSELSYKSITAPQQMRM